MTPQLFARAIVSIERKYGLSLDAQDIWLRLDGVPCGRGWVGTKPGCKRGKSAKEVAGLKVGTPETTEEDTKGKLKDTLQQLKSKLEASIEKDKKAGKKTTLAKEPKSQKKTKNPEVKKENPDNQELQPTKKKAAEGKAAKLKEKDIPIEKKDPIAAKAGTPKDFSSLIEEFQKTSQEILRLKADLSSAYNTGRKAPTPAQKKKAEKLYGEIEIQLKTARKKEEDRKAELVVGYINKNKSDPKDQITHGMAEVERQWSVDLGGIKAHSADEANKDSAVVKFAIELAGRKPPYPEKFLSHTTDIHFASTRNVADAYWEKKYNKPGFTSAATGGDGTVVVYSGKTIPLSAFSHEAGHNFAGALYGSEDPPADSYYAKSTQKLAQVSAYAKNSIGESFAEDVSNYFDRPKSSNSMETTNPERYKIIKEIIDGSKDRGYAKKTLADYR